MSVGFTLSLSSGVTDLAGNALAPFVRTFTPRATVLLGEVYDDAIGRPLTSAKARLLASGGQPTVDPKPLANVTGNGTFALPALPGDALVEVSATGYLPVYRREAVDSGSSGTASATLFDTRLTPIAVFVTGTATMSGTTYSVPFGTTTATLVAPAGSLASGTRVRLTVRRPQGLPVLAPLGWSVASAVNVAFEDAAGAAVIPTGSVTLTLPDFYGATSSTALLLASLDPAALLWVAEGSATVVSNTTLLTAAISHAGDYAILVPDPSPTAPPASTLGAPLAGVTMPAEDPLQTATVVANPVDVLPAQTANVGLTVDSASPVPSGFPVQTLVTEELTLLDGSTLSAPSFISDLVLLHRGDGSVGLSIPVRASEGAQHVALSVGYERFTVKKFPFEVRQGTVVGSSGGTVTGAMGWSVTLSAGAVPTATSVALTPLAVNELPAAIPTGFSLIAAVKLGTGGVRFALPADLSAQVPSAMAPAAGRDVLLVQFDEWNGYVIFRPIARASFDAATLTVKSLHVDHTQFPWSGVTGEGTYAFLSSSDLLAYVSGRVFDVDGSTLSGVRVDALSWPLTAVTEPDGTFATAIRAAGATLTSANPTTLDVGAVSITPPSPGAEMKGIDLRLQITAPYVVSVTPTPNTVILVGSRFVVNLSEA
ncbi:MAG TPA: hypothetical protein VGR00_11620, partial [Thermoanaerobaculia bacterium]|nr:hypothetical protein [Thermoanaerobaculia bacterium]